MLKNNFQLTVIKGNQPELKMDVVNTLSAGSDPRNDLVLIGKEIKPKHFRFQRNADFLVLEYLGGHQQSFLNSLPLEENKKYVLETGDVLTASGTKIFMGENI